MSTHPANSDVSTDPSPLASLWIAFQRLSHSSRVRVMRTLGLAEAHEAGVDSLAVWELVFQRAIEQGRVRALVDEVTATEETRYPVPPRRA